MGASMRASPVGTPAGGQPTRSKWWGILRGVVSILFGLVILAWPAITLRALLLVFGVFAVATGVFAILRGLQADGRRGRWMHLGKGIVAVLAGIMALGWPRITAFALLYLIAAWAIVTGVMEMAGAFQTRLIAMPEWLLLASGLISVVFGILLLVWPYMGVLALVWLIGIYALVYGIIHLVLAVTEGPARKAPAI